MIHLLTASASVVSLILMVLVSIDTPCPMTFMETFWTLALAACLGAIISRSVERALR